MKPPEDVKRGILKQWLTKAENDFNLAGDLLREKKTYLDAIGFHSQQAAEKYLKAFLVYKQVDFPKTHNLGEILDLVESINTDLSDSLREATALNPYAIQVRYPDDYPDITLEDIETAFKLAALVREKVMETLKEYLQNDEIFTIKGR